MATSQYETCPSLLLFGEGAGKRPLKDLRLHPDPKAEHQIFSHASKVGVFGFGKGLPPNRTLLLPPFVVHGYRKRGRAMEQRY